MKISSIMTKEVVTVGMDTTLRTICRIFDEKKFHHLFVVENDELCGVISDRDLFKALSPFLKTAAEQNRDLATLSRHAHQIMSRKPITISKDTSSKDAVRLMMQKNISCLPVMSSDGQIEGVVTKKDLLVAYSKQIDDIS
jgi:acetoin utilization protein AcuB